MESSLTPRGVHYLVHLSLPPSQSSLEEELLAHARSFFDILGGAERQDLGSYWRVGKDTSSPERHFESMLVPKGSGQSEPILVARRLEVSLRSLLEIVNVKREAVEVFARTVP